MFKTILISAIYLNEHLILILSKIWPTGERNDKQRQYSCLENPMKRQKIMKLEDEPWLVSIKYTTGEEQSSSSRKNEEVEPMWKQCPVVDVSGGESKV